jgi:hypothetical protein
MNNAEGILSCTSICVNIGFYFSSACIGNGIAGNTARLLFKEAATFYMPSTVSVGSDFSKYLSECVITRLFYSSHSTWV